MVRRFADALAWNWIIGGTDAHAKNYSLLLSGSDVRLAPLYDIASALPYVTAAIGPLLPGSATYFGLLEIARNNLNPGLASLSKAAALALAIAIGVNLGGELSRLFLKAPRVAGGQKGRRAAKRTRGF